jgi:uncharacterized protein with HEPN domain
MEMETKPDTSVQYQKVVGICKEIFDIKTTEYGTSWRIFRLSSLTDQIYIKAQRIRTLEIIGEANAKVPEGIKAELIGIINYGVIALIQSLENLGEALELIKGEVVKLYSHHINETFSLMRNKNHDYGEAWRNMRCTTFTDMILTKLLRIKQIEDNKGRTIISEDVNAGYRDIINYSIFYMIKMGESDKNETKTN